MRLPDFRIEILIRRIDKKVIITNCLSAVHSPTLTKEKPNQILSGGGRTKQQANKNTWAHIQTHTCTPTSLTLNPWLNPFSQTDIKRSKKEKKKATVSSAFPGSPLLFWKRMKDYRLAQLSRTFHSGARWVRWMWKWARGCFIILKKCCFGKPPNFEQ